MKPKREHRPNLPNSTTDEPGGANLSPTSSKPYQSPADLPPKPPVAASE